MATGDVKRKLTAIFSADVEGYSRLMEEDELSTVETLTSHKEIMGKLIKQYRGRVVDSTGDNLLAEFGSVVDAVQCAVEVQQVLSAKNDALPENRRMNFRIGINSGDVIEEGELIYGDGVNVAARMESLAKGGGISISGTAFDQLGKKLPLGYEYLGEQTVKNIRKPVRVYRVLTEEEAVGKVIGEKRAKPKRWRWAAVGAVAVLIIVVGALAIWNFYFRPAFEPASVEKMAFPLPDKPSIAVLPFTNMSGDPEQEYIGDGISENIISALSKVSEMFVIARNSTFTYKGKAVKIQQVAEELGVQYVLEGSVQKSGERLRVTAQLIDALNGQHLWSEKYDRKMRELFDLQDEITQKIVVALQLELTPGDQARLYARSTDNLEAWSNVVKGYDLFYRWNKEDNDRARELFESAIELDSGYVSAWAWLALTYFYAASRAWTDSPADYFRRAHEAIQKALNLDDKSAHAHSILGLIYLLKREHDKAIVEQEKAISLDPNDSFNYGRLGQIMFYAGQFEDAIELLKKAMRLSPYYPIHYLAFIGRSHAQLGRYEEAILVFNEIVERCRRGECPRWMGLPGLAYCYAELGREEEAMKFKDEFLRLNPSWFEMENREPFKDEAIRKNRYEQLRKLGLPKTPPLPLPDKPSIAVLPFVNMSGDPEQEYFSDGISEEIITALSKTPKMFVIARTSSFKYKGKEVDVRRVGRELGVRHVLEGSVRIAGDKIRITAQLADAKTGNHLWAERYDRELKDIFAIQDEITLKILTALQVKLQHGEQARLFAKGTNNLNAYLKLLKVREYLLNQNRDDNIIARQLAQEAIALDPEFPAAHYFLAWTHIMDPIYGSTKSPRKSIEKAAELAQKVLALDDSNFMSYLLSGYLYLRKRHHEKAIAEYERAIALNPNAAAAHAWLGIALNYVGRPEDAIRSFKKAMRLNPIPPSFYLVNLGRSYRMVGQYEDSIATYKKVFDSAPNNLLAHAGLTATYSLAGRLDEARGQAVEVLRVDRKFSAERYAKKWPYKDKAETERLIDALRKAGLPD
jgi:adenylate cyclase